MHEPAGLVRSCTVQEGRDSPQAGGWCSCTLPPRPTLLAAASCLSARMLARPLTRCAFCALRSSSRCSCASMARRLATAACGRRRGIHAHAHEVGTHRVREHRACLPTTRLPHSSPLPQPQTQQRCSITKHTHMHMQRWVEEAQRQQCSCPPEGAASMGPFPMPACPRPPTPRPNPAKDTLPHAPAAAPHPARTPWQWQPPARPGPARTCPAAPQIPEGTFGVGWGGVGLGHGGAAHNVRPNCARNSTHHGPCTMGHHLPAPANKQSRGLPSAAPWPRAPAPLGTHPHGRQLLLQRCFAAVQAAQQLVQDLQVGLHKTRHVWRPRPQHHSSRW